MIDKYINNNYEKILTYIKKSIWKFKRFGVEPEFILSSVYLHLKKNEDKLKCDSDIKKYISTYIHNNLYWENGVRELGQKGLKKNRLSTELDLNKHDMPNDDYDFENVNYYDDLEATCELWRQKQKSLHKQIIYDVYFIEGKNTTRKFAEHFGMSTFPAWSYIKTMKEELVEFKKSMGSK
jgi:hypothetical protein